MDNEKLAQLRCDLVSMPELWQFDLLTPQRLWQFSKDRGVPVFMAETVTSLWRVGLLRADLITSRSMLETPNLELVFEESGQFVYCDMRQVEHRAEGYGGIIGKTESESDDLELLFHPFRMNVLEKIDHTFRSTTSSIQYLS